MTEEASPAETMTPMKPTTNFPVLKTPTGGSLYNTFHKDYVDRPGEASVTPGLFASFKSSALKTEAIKPIPITWSPEVQGDHFPTHIDENPTYQLQMQQNLDADIEEAAQSKITDYFRSNIIAPGLDATRSLKDKPALPRTSSLKPIFPLGSRSGEQAWQKATELADGVQTNVSISLEVDLPSLLRKAEDESYNFSQNGIVCAEAWSERTEHPHPFYRWVMCPSCLERKPSSFFKQRSLFDESSDGDTTVAATCTPYDTRSMPTTEITSFESMESMADDLGLPVSWLSTSVSSSLHQRLKRSPQDVDRFNRSDSTNLTGLLEQAEIDSCRTPSHGRKPPHFFESVSPLIAGRASPEARGLQRPLPLSFMMDNEGDEEGGGDEESTQDSCMPHKRQCKHESRTRGMASPNLSPICCPTDHAPMDDDEDNYVDVDAFPFTVTDVKDNNENDENLP